MKSILTILLISLLPSGFLFAQEQKKDSTAVADTTAVAEAPEITDKPVKFSWESQYLINQQTSKISPVKTLEFVIQHRFGPMENGRKDLWGVYAPGANVRLGLDYVIYKKVQIGYGLTKANMTSDFNVKWNVLEQKTESMPISLTLLGNIGIDGREKAVWDTAYYNYSDVQKFYRYKFSNRLSYFSEILIGSKLTQSLTVQGGVSFTHYNTVAAGHDHDIVGFHLGARYKVSPQGSVIFTGDFPMRIKDISEGQKTNRSYENIAIGYEVSTGSHAFQIFAGTSNALLPQDVMMNNLNKIQGKNFSLGFVITRLWSF
jgi:hypothetical protein